MSARTSHSQNKSYTTRIVSVVVVVFVVLAWLGLQVFDTSSHDVPATRSLPGAVDISTRVQSGAEADRAQASAEQLAHADPQCFEEGVVERVVDGDTLIVRIDGERVRVRLVGINAPESVHEDESRNTSEGRQSSEHLKTLVSEGETVYLQQDTSYTDQYDRRLAYVWDVLPHDVDDAFNPQTIAEHMINAWQVIDGHAQARTYQPDTLHDQLLQAFESEASA